jgi:hypothetical protein
LTGVAPGTLRVWERRYGTVTQRQQIADQTARQIDEEVRAIVERNYERARRLLSDNLRTLHAMADALMRYETLCAEQIDDLMNGREPQPPEESSAHGGITRRPRAGTGMRPRPSSASTCPVTQSASSVSKIHTADAISPGSPMRCKG